MDRRLFWRTRARKNETDDQPVITPFTKCMTHSLNVQSPVFHCRPAKRCPSMDSLSTEDFYLQVATNVGGKNMIFHLRRMLLRFVLFEPRNCTRMHWLNRLWNRTVVHAASLSSPINGFHIVFMHSLLQQSLLPAYHCR